MHGVERGRYSVSDKLRARIPYAIKVINEVTRRRVFAETLNDTPAKPSCYKRGIEPRRAPPERVLYFSGFAVTSPSLGDPNTSLSSCNNGAHVDVQIK